jgi:chromosomal replication initiation ATPase DnaA
MSSIELDLRYTFESFVIGGGNRLATAAARRVAESPGTTYNPLFIYSASGLGKTHLVSAIGHHAKRLLPALRLVYDTLEHFMDEVMAAIERGERESFRERLGEIDVLLLDDVQFLAGRHRTQEELLRAWDALSARGGQVVLTSDRPPQEIDGLDDRLLSRFSGGLIVDIGAPDYETRVAIARRKAEARGQSLGDGVAETLARIAFGNVRELQGALNRLLAVQELEGRAVRAEEVARLLGRVAGPAELDEFGDFLSEITDALEDVVTHAPAERQLADAIARWEREGYRTRRLELALLDPDMHAEAEALVRGYEAAVERLREVAGEIASLEPDAPELGRTELLRDPDRVDEAEALLGDVRERMRPLPHPPAGASFASLALPAELLAVRAAAAVAERPGEGYNPLFIHGDAGTGKSALLAALGNRLLEREPELPVAFVEGHLFAAELIQALERNRAESWRARYRRARALLFDDVDALADTERAQEELFHLFDALQRAGAQLAFCATRAPEELAGIEERLRTRLGSGLVVELSRESAAAAAGSAGVAGSAAARDGGQAAASGPDTWFIDREKIVWDWPYVADLIVEEWE